MKRFLTLFAGVLRVCWFSPAEVNCTGLGFLERTSLVELDAETEEETVVAAVTFMAVASTSLSRNCLLIGSRADAEITGRSEAEMAFGNGGS